MKHFIKRVSALALACVLVIAMGCPAFSANKEDSIALDKSDVEMKEFLTTRGFTEDYLDALIPQQLEILYQTCYSNDAYFLSVTKIPVAVPYGNISTDQLELEATYCSQSPPTSCTCCRDNFTRSAERELYHRHGQ